MNLIEELGRKYGTDKVTKHHYQDFYYEMFKDRRLEVKKVLEIGIAEGAGLKMFKDFFPNAQIFGMDNNLDRVVAWANKEPIRVYPGDQSIRTDLEELIQLIGGDIDLVIDDGSHRLEDQVSTCITLMNLLHYGAVYVIEDVADEKVAEQLYKFYPEVKKVGERYDDRLVVMKIDE